MSLPPAEPPRELPPRPIHEAEDARRDREFRAADAFDDPRQGGEMPFLSHLDELRKVLQHSLAAILAGAMIGWWFAPRVLSDLIARTVKIAIVMSPFEAFNERLKMAGILGLTVTLPFVLWRLWAFIVPGLLKGERRWIIPLSFGSFVLFLLGGAASYYYVTPLVIHVLERFVTPGMQTQIRLSFLLDFFYNLALACGLLAQLPLVTMLLTSIGLVTPMFLLKQWRVAIVVIFIVTAAITPGDVVSAQLVMGAPMAALYFLSVGLSFFVAKKKAAAETQEFGEPGKGATHV
jgi:sec-independent protein translocase protein TatC